MKEPIIVFGNQFVQAIHNAILLIKMMTKEIQSIFISIISIKCDFLNGACKNQDCSDLTGAYYKNDANCQVELPYCISNRVDKCIIGCDCTKLFKLLNLLKLSLKTNYLLKIYDNIQVNNVYLIQLLMLIMYQNQSMQVNQEVKIGLYVHLLIVNLIALPLLILQLINYKNRCLTCYYI